MRVSLGSLAVAAVLLGGATPALADGALTVTATTSPNGGPYAPSHVLAIWVQGPNGQFVKTIGRWAAERRQHLVAWTTAAGAADADAVSGATRNTHATPVTVTWNLRDKTNTVIPDGTYTIRMELADQNANLANQTRQGTFTFVKGPTAQMQTALTNNGYTNVSINFNPNANSCNNGVVDTGETCDGSSCPTTCAASADACAPNVLVGDAQTCTAACMTQTISACTSGDSCCPVGCEATDSDCDDPGASGGGGEFIEGGCATSGGHGDLLAFGLLGVIGLVSTRRRQRVSTRTHDRKSA